MLLITAYNDCGYSVCNHASTLAEDRITLISGDRHLLPVEWYSFLFSAQETIFS